MNKIKIGWGEASLVPEGRKVTLVGQFYERISGEVETPIKVNALAIECGDDSVIFCACDLVGTPYSLLEDVRAALPEGFPKDKLMLSAIHTHTSIGIGGRSDGLASIRAVLESYLPAEYMYKPLVSDDSPEVMKGLEAREFVIERIVKAVLEAWESRKEGYYATGFGRAAIGMCRRVCYDDGSAKMWGNSNSANFTELEAGNDSGIELLFTYDENKKLTGVVANVACPSQVLEHQNFISSDYMGKTRALIQEKYGSDVGFLGLVSPAGDMCPRDLIRWVGSEVTNNDPNIPKDNRVERKADPSMFEVKGANLAAKRVATEIFWALDDVTEFIGETELVHKNLSIDLPIRRVTIEEYEKADKALRDFANQCKAPINFEDNAMMQIYSGTVARYKLQQTKDLFTIESHVLRLGDVAFATNPFELFLNYGNQIRARSKASQTFLIQLCCGVFGYLPTERAENGSHYSAFVGSGTAGHEGGNLLVRKTLTEINEMFKD